MGVLPGITGSLMANEVIKIITGTGDVLSGKVLIFNIFSYSFNILNVKNLP
jgi:adenylyltransferase/sulfurtransferase